MNLFRFTQVLFCSLLLALFASAVYAADDSSVTASQAALQTAPPKFLYSTDYTAGKVHGYLVNPSTGVLTPTGQNPPWAHFGPTKVVSDKGGYRLYVINWGSKDIDAYFIYRNNGYIYQVPGSPFAIGQNPTGVAVHPSGKFVYVTTINGAVYAFAVESNGSLKPVAGSPFTTQNQPAALAIDPTGHYLYTNDNSNKIDAFSINETDGALTPVPGSPFAQTSSACDDGGIDIAVDPSGKFLILPQYCTGVEVFRIDSANGSIAQVAGSPFPIPADQGPEAAQSVAIDPLDRWVFIDAQSCNSGCGNLTETYALNKTTGALSFLEYGSGGCGNYNRTDPSGKFLYSIGPEDNCSFGVPTTILGLAINQSNGSLKDVPGSPFPFTTNSAAPGQVGLVITP
ncbi:MAG TPA: beta-propeller fold lactonase family protein [Terriglobales bacterium]|nr:beta-propeller fold lactonase family protein [Terriglobales bacterium]